MADGDITIGGNLEQFAKQIGTSIEESLAIVAEQLYNEIIANNPVATGFSKSNWNLSLGEPDTTVEGTRDPRAFYEPKDEKVPPNPDLQEVYISNGVEYIQFLEEGSSSQAPNGFIQLAIDRVEANVQDIVDGRLTENVE